MESSNLDETSPTSVRPEGQPATDKQGRSEQGVSPFKQEVDGGVTRPMVVSSEEKGAEVKPIDSSKGASQGGNSGEQSIIHAQPPIPGDERLTPPPVLPDQPVDTPTSKRKWILWAFVGVLLLALIAAGSAFAGYNSAIDQRTRHQSTLVAGEAANQYVLAQQDIAQGNYNRARQRLEYIIQIDPNYPNASDQLAYVLTQQRITATPTFAPTLTLTPTPDFRGRDELFAQGQNLLISRDWTGAIDTLLLLRKSFPDYMAVRVDGMLFVALRNRGVDKIATLHDLEGGNYDLTLAERFGPLDAEARNWRDWAELYIRGASFWDVDWGQVVYYFSQLASAAPNLSDISGWTASNRYMDALLGYGDWFAARGQWCDAQAQYDMYMSLLASPQVEPTAIFAANQCAQGVEAPTATPGGEMTLTPTPTPPAPIDTEQPTTTPYP